MSCLNPYLRIRIGNHKRQFVDDGILSEKSRVVLDIPSNRKNLEEMNIPYDVIPCGICDDCYKKRVKEWSIRIFNECKYHKENYFITLTYDDEHINKNHSLDKKRLQRFFKTLKEYLSRDYPDIKIKYYAVGEYGDGKGERCYLNPHYHFIVFGLNLSHIDLTYDFPDGRRHYSQSGDLLMYSSWLSNIWKEGFVTIQEVTFGSASYVAGYVHKKLKESKPVIHEEIDFFHDELGRAYSMVYPVRYDPYQYLGVEKPFSLMSKGIGLQYFNEHQDTIYKTDEVFFDSGEFGVKSSKPPRYYDKKLEQHNEYKAKEIKDNRRLLASTTLHLDTDKDVFYNKVVRSELLETKKKNRKRGLTSLT